MQNTTDFPLNELVNRIVDTLNSRQKCVFTLTLGYLQDTLRTQLNRGEKQNILDVIIRHYKLKILHQGGGRQGNSTIYYVTDKDILKEWGYTRQKVRSCKEKALKAINVPKPKKAKKEEKQSSGLTQEQSNVYLSFYHGVKVDPSKTFEVNLASNLPMTKCFKKLSFVYWGVIDCLPIERHPSGHDINGRKNYIGAFSLWVHRILGSDLKNTKKVARINHLTSEAVLWAKEYRASFSRPPNSFINSTSQENPPQNTPPVKVGKPDLKIVKQVVNASPIESEEEPKEEIKEEANVSPMLNNKSSIGFLPSFDVFNGVTDPMEFFKGNERRVSSITEKDTVGLDAQSLEQADNVFQPCLGYIQKRLDDIGNKRYLTNITKDGSLEILQMSSIPEYFFICSFSYNKKQDKITINMHPNYLELNEPVPAYWSQKMARLVLGKYILPTALKSKFNPSEIQSDYVELRQEAEMLGDEDEEFIEDCLHPNRRAPEWDHPVIRFV